MDLLLHNLRTIGTHHCDQTVGEEAAMELERLRTENAELRQQQIQYVGKSATQQAEIQKLQHVLRTLLGETEDSDYMTGAEQRQMARDALPPND